MRKQHNIYLFDGKEFYSKQEITAYKFLKQKYPDVEIFSNFPVGYWFIDFKINVNPPFFIEYHPLRRKETFMKYYRKRRWILNTNGYPTNKLYVFTSLQRLRSAKLPD